MLRIFGLKEVTGGWRQLHNEKTSWQKGADGKIITP
jgi:hypothetical protein